MKKVIFYLSSFLGLLHLIMLLKVLVFDYNSLTVYGWGNWTGKFILLLLFAMLSYWSGKEIWKKYLQ